MIKNLGWRGLLFDGANENKGINLYREFITADNIISIFDKYEAPIEPDYISIDIDSCDLWVFKSILTKYKPLLISVEYNSHLLIDCSITFPNDPNERWQGDCIHGASLKH